MNKKLFFSYLHVYVCFSYIYVYVPLVHDALRDQKKALDSLGLELQMVVRTMWVLEIKSEFCGRIAHALNH